MKGWTRVASSDPAKRAAAAVLKTAVPGCTRISCVMRSNEDPQLYRGACLVPQQSFEHRRRPLFFVNRGDYTAHLLTGQTAKIED